MYLIVSLSYILDENCPVSNDFKSGGFSCPHGCLNGNIGYSDFASAWKNCEQINGCGKIMKYTDGNFYLRRSSDEKFEDSRVQYVDFRCLGTRYGSYLFHNLEFD